MNDQYRITVDGQQFLEEPADREFVEYFRRRYGSTMNIKSEPWEAQHGTDVQDPGGKLHA